MATQYIPGPPPVESGASIISGAMGGFAEGLQAANQMILSQKESDRRDAAFVWQQEQAKISRDMEEKRMRMATEMFNVNMKKFKWEEEDRKKNETNTALYNDLLAEMMATPATGKTSGELSASRLANITAIASSEKYRNLPPTKWLPMAKTLSELSGLGGATIHKTVVERVPGTGKSRTRAIYNDGTSEILTEIPEGMDADVAKILDDSMDEWWKLLSRGAQQIKDALQLKNMSKGGQLVMSKIVQGEDPATFLNDAISVLPELEAHAMEAVKKVTGHGNYYDFVRSRLKRFDLTEEALDGLMRKAFPDEYVDGKQLMELQDEWYNRFNEMTMEGAEGEPGESILDLESLEAAIETEFGDNRDPRNLIAAKGAVRLLRMERGLYAEDPRYAGFGDAFNLTETDPVTGFKTPGKRDPMTPIEPEDNPYNEALARDFGNYDGRPRIENHQMVTAVMEGDPYVEGWPGVTGILRASEAQLIINLIREQNMDVYNDEHVNLMYRRLIEIGRIEEKDAVMQETGEQLGELMSANSKFEEMMAGGAAPEVGYTRMK